MHYIVYQITNLINGKIYVGCHVTKNINDSYMGSGIAIVKAIKKYGKENFKKEILAECNNQEMMLDLERKIVNNEFVKNQNTYNMVRGGNYDTRTDRTKPEISKKLKGRIFSEETRKKMSGKVVVKDKNGNIFKVSVNDPRYLNGELQCYAKGRKLSPEQCLNISIRNRGKKRSDEHKLKMSINSTGEKNSFYGKTHTIETKQKIGLKNKHPRLAPFTDEHRKNLSITSSKERNSGFGKVWITSNDLLIIKRVLPTDLNMYLASGWILGRKIHLSGSKKMLQSKENK